MGKKVWTFFQPCFPELQLTYNAVFILAVQQNDSVTPTRTDIAVAAQPPRRVRLFATPRTAARQASLPITNSWNLLKLMSIELVMPSNHLILCRRLLLLPSILPSIRVSSSESVLCVYICTML